MMPNPLATKPKRLERAKRMTICVGIISGEGVVIAADTQESAGDGKRDQNKLIHVSCGMPKPDTGTPGATFIATGAGDAGYLDAFFYQLSKNVYSCNGMNHFEAYMAEQIRSFHEDHIFPISERGVTPAILDVLVGATSGWNTGIFVTSGSTLRRATFHCAVGIGSHFAQSLLNQHSWCKTLREAQLLAAYVIYLTKSQVAHCGLHTSISSLHNSVMDVDTDGNISYHGPNTPMEVGFDQEQLRRWETSFDTKWKARQKALVSELMAEELEA
jgi:hypothetical protein